MDSKNIIDISQNDFENKVIEASKNKLIVVDFWAPWCGPCKQLTPIMEKTATENPDKFDLIKINIDENQEIASQLNIQSIPTVYAFKDKKIVNAFQGVISEKDFINFVEKSMGEKLKEDLSNFYNKIKSLIDEKKFHAAKDDLLIFLTENSEDAVAVSLFLECLIGLKEFQEIDSFISSLNQEMKNHKEIDKIIKKIKILEDSKNSQPIDSLIAKYNTNPKDIKTVLAISEYYFASGDYENAFPFLLNNFFKDKEKVKKKLIDFFEALGNEHEATRIYRKKLSSLIFS